MTRGTEAQSARISPRPAERGGHRRSGFEVARGSLSRVLVVLPVLPCACSVAMPVDKYSGSDSGSGTAIGGTSATSGTTVTNKPPMVPTQSDAAAVNTGSRCVGVYACVCVCVCVSGFT
jgi:hypothetical protein